MLILLLALANSTTGVPVISGPAPAAATAWVDNTEASCGSSRLRIVQPKRTESGGSDGRARVEVDGKPVHGEQMAEFVQDLSVPQAAYRFQVLCGEGEQFQIRVNRGLADERGHVAYHASSASVSGEELVFYSELEEVDPATFWYR